MSNDTQRISRLESVTSKLVSEKENVVSIADFPRKVPESNDEPRINRAINACPDKGTLLLSGEITLSSGLVVDSKNITILGQGVTQDGYYRLYGVNSAYPGRKNKTVLCWDEVKTGTQANPYTMLKFTDTQGIKPSIFAANFALDGLDGVFNDLGSAYYTGNVGQPDQTCTFTGAYSNGLDASADGLQLDTERLVFVGFSGYGAIYGCWQRHFKPRFSLCNVPFYVAQSDVTVVNPEVHHCKFGPILSDTDPSVIAANMTRLLDVRIEWIEQWGIQIKKGNDIIITGKIDRCGYAGIVTNGAEIWHLNIDVNVSRCGCAWRGSAFSDLTSNDASMQQASNLAIYNVKFSQINGINIIQNSRDDGQGANAPTIGIYMNQVNYCDAPMEMGNFRSVATSKDIFTYACNCTTWGSADKRTVNDNWGNWLIDLNGDSLNKAQALIETIYGTLLLADKAVFKLPVYSDGTSPANPTEGYAYIDNNHNLKVYVNGTFKTVTLT